MIGLPIFMYHHVSESVNLSLKSMQISPDKFECQMRFLYQKGFRCLSLSEVTTNWEQGRPQPNHSFVLTFDDAYIDFYENAAPILKNFGFNTDRIRGGKTRRRGQSTLPFLAGNERTCSGSFHFRQPYYDTSKSYQVG